MQPVDKVQALIIKSSKDFEVLYNKDDFSQKVVTESTLKEMSNLIAKRFLKYEQNKNFKTFDSYQDFTKDIATRV